MEVLASGVPKHTNANVTFAPPQILSLWLERQLNSNAVANNVSVVFKLNESAEIEKFQKSARSLVETHSSLRSTFRFVDGRLQMSARRPEFTVVKIETTTLQQLGDDRNLQARLESYFSDNQRARLLDGAGEEQSPGYRFDAVVDERSPKLILYFQMTFDHMVADGESLEILIEDFCANLGASAPLDRTPETDFYDYSSSIQLEANSLRAQKTADAWRSELRGAVPFALEAPRLLHGTNQRQLISIFRSLSIETSSRISEFAGKMSVTPFTVLSAATTAFLSRWSKQIDGTMGVLFSLRTRLELSRTVGHLVNALPVRFNLQKPDLAFEELVRLVHSRVMWGLRNASVPYDVVVAELRSQSGTAETELFKVALNWFQRSVRPPWKSVGMERIDLKGQAAAFDLDFIFVRSGECYELILSYNQDRFTAAFMERVADAMIEFLAQAVAHPGQGIDQPALLSPAEVERLHLEVTFRGPLRGDLDVIDKIEARAREFGDHVAFELVESSRPGACLDRLTYREFNDRTNEIAERLRAAGVKRGDFVGICLERDLSVPVAVIAVLRLGAAYVPLDPTYPSERLRSIVEDAKCRVVITQMRTTERAVYGFATPPAIFEIDRLAFLRTSPIESIRAEVSPSDLAYCLYTSGSTGTPKGVMISRRALGSHLETILESYKFKSNDRMLFFMPISFDGSIEQLFGGLACGCTIVMRGEEIWDPERVPTLLKGYQISIAYFPTPYWNYWGARTQEFVDSLELRFLCVGGEAMLVPPGPLRVREDLAIINGYGPTETTVTASFYRVESGEVPGPSYPIGRPHRGSEVYVLDEQYRPVPAGARGEIYIAGYGVAEGYLNRPSLTAERFVPHLYDPNRKMYRTGDEARMSDNGEIEFLGRADHQVKIRGFRIEIGEVETACRSLPGVEDVAVIAVAPSPDAADRESFLAAFLVGGRSEIHSTVVNHLSTLLPSYMIPSRFVYLDAIPLNSSGKVDRKRLALMPMNKEAPTVKAEPANAIQRQLLQLWKEILKRDDLGITDGFFESGGQSLLAMALLTRIEAATGVHVSLKTLMEHPNVESLSLAVVQDNRESLFVDVKPSGEFRARSSRLSKARRIFIVPGAAMSPVPYRRLAGLLSGVSPTTILQVAGLDGRSSMHESIEDMVEAYMAAILSRVPSDRKTELVFVAHSFGGIVAFEMAKKFEQRGQRVRVALVDSLFDIGETELDLIESEASESDSDSVLDPSRRVLRHQANLQLKHRRTGQLKGPVEFILAGDGELAEKYESLTISKARQASAGDFNWLRLPGNHFSIFEEPHAEPLALAIVEFIEHSSAAVDVEAKNSLDSNSAH